MERKEEYKNCKGEKDERMIKKIMSIILNKQMKEKREREREV